MDLLPFWAGWAVLRPQGVREALDRDPWITAGMSGWGEPEEQGVYLLGVLRIRYKKPFYSHQEKRGSRL